MTQEGADWSPHWSHLTVEEDTVGDELVEGPRLTVTYQFQRTPDSPLEERVFPGLLHQELEALFGDKFEWLGGDPDLL